MKLDYSQIVAVYMACLAFATVYDQVINYLAKKGYLEGFMSLAVAFGCLVILGIVATINIDYVLLVFGGFVAGGLPMIVGSIIRYMIKRHDAQETIRHER